MTFAYLLLALNLLTSREVPAGTPLHLRLTSAVGSYASKPGDQVHAVLIAPVVAGSETLLPEGSSLMGTVKSVQRVGLGIRHETAALNLEFTKVTLPGGDSFPVSARVMEVDNSRERVEQDGTIRAVRTTGSLTYRVSGYIRTALHWEIHAELAAWMIRALVVQVPEPELFYPAGVELTLTLTQPMASGAYTEPGKKPPMLTEDERAGMDGVVAALPSRAYVPVSNRPSDLVNVLLVGSRDQLAAAFVAAGWTEADMKSLRSNFKNIRAFAQGTGYREAPMSSLLLNDSEPDMYWQKGFDDTSKRHHIRLWKQPERWNGEEVWIGTATHDIDYAYMRPGHAWTHKIEENVDQERDKVVNDLVFTSCVDLVDSWERPGMTAATTNGTGDRMNTDTRLAVVRLNSCGQPRLSTQTIGVEIPAYGNRWQRIVRRQILSARSDFLRHNPYYRGFEGARWLVLAIRRHEQRGNDADPAHFSTAETTHAGRFSHSVTEFLR